MKKTVMMAIAIAAVLSLGSCKSQKTLSEATTVADTEEEITEVEPIQYVKPTTTTTAAPVVETPATTTPVVTAVTRPATPDRTEKVTVVESVDTGKLKGFNVIVGSFGSKTNAENQKAKMVNRGYKSAFLVQNANGMYRVVAASFDTREAATTIRDVIRSTYPTESGTCAEAWLLIPQQ